MNALHNKISRFALIVLMGVFTVKTVGQELSKSEMEAHANSMYIAGYYDNACSDYKKLYNIYPKEVKYNYAYGKSLVMANKSLDLSIDLLRYAAARNTYTDAHYYLALAYYRNYQFDDAEVALWNFMNLGSKKEKRDLKPEALKSNIERAREELYLVKKQYPVSKITLKNFQIEAAYGNHINGKFSYMPESFLSNADRINSFKGIMYYPAVSENGTKYYISSFGPQKNDHTDLFWIEQITAINFTLPEAIPALNSEFNEAYPYFDPIEQVVYFSSDRPGGLGGYDIFKSTYNSGTNTFSVPQRLEFPINSSYDDYLFVPDSLHNTAVFLSNRESYGIKLTAYKIKLGMPADFVSPKDMKDVRELALLNPEPVNDVPYNEEKIVKGGGVKMLDVPDQYNVLIQQALQKQLFCDSLKAAQRVLEAKLSFISEADERRIVFSGIAALKQQYEIHQTEVDNLFAQAQNLAPEPEIIQEVTQNNQDNQLVAVKEINGMKVYHFDPQITPQAETESLSTQKIPKEKSLAGFTILSDSPYGDKKPIPAIEKLPEGLIYRIQLGAFGKKQPSNAFGGLTPVSYEFLSDRKLTKYYVGHFMTSKDARTALEQVRNYGYNDAFIVPFINNKKVSIEEARELEFGQKL